MRIVDNESVGGSKPSANNRTRDMRRIFLSSHTVKKFAKWFPFKRKSQQNRSLFFDYTL